MLTFISVIALILGIILIILVAINRFPAYKTGLIVGALFLLAVAVGGYLLDQNETPPQVTLPPTEAAAEATPAGVDSASTSSISPISPVSVLPTPTPTPIVTEMSISEAGFEGCLLFTSNRTGDLEIYSMSQSADNIQQLTNSPNLDIDPAWAPDGAQIAFASNRDSEAGLQIYIMSADGSDPQMVGPVQSGENSHPSWSPDGSRIIYQSKRDLNGSTIDDNNDIYIINSDGSEPEQLLMFHSAEDVDPSWSPGGDKIAFISDRTNRDEVYLMDSDGANVTQMTELNVIKSGLNWSSDGRYLVFEGGGDIYKLDVETREVVKIVAFKETNESTPVLTQNEDQIIFSSDRTTNWNLYIADQSVPGSLNLAQLSEGAHLDRSSSWYPCQ